MKPQNRFQLSASPMLFQRIRAAMLSSVLLGSLALSPQTLLAQDYDTWALNREVLNAAANYTGVLTTAHSEVRKYITWDWNTALDVAAQQERTTAILDEISDTGQISDTLVPSLNMAVVNDYGVGFRYCDGMLLSYFTSTGFKHGLSAQQIVDAPVLRARRADTTFYGEPLGIVEDGLMLNTGDRRQAIPACMGTEYGGALDVDTVAYMTSAAEKFGVARVRKRRETQKLRCVAPQVGPGIKQERFKSTDYNAQGDKLYNSQSTRPYDPEDTEFDFSYLDTTTPESTTEGDGHWKTKYEHCRAPATIPVRRVEPCSPGSDRIATYEYFLTEAYAAFPETVWLPSDAQGEFVDEVDGVLVPHLSFCEGAPDRQTLDPVITTREEPRDPPVACQAEYPRYPLGTVTEARTITIRTWSFADSPDVVDFPALSDIVIEREGPWVRDDKCFRNANDQTTETKRSSCPAGQKGSVTYQRQKTVTGVDYHSDGWQDALSTTHTRWTTASNSCHRSCGWVWKGGGRDGRGWQRDCGGGGGSGETSGGHAPGNGGGFGESNAGGDGDW